MNLIIGVIAGAIAGGLIEYLLGLILPKEPKIKHLAAVIVGVLSFALIASLVSPPEEQSGEVNSSSNGSIFPSSTVPSEPTISPEPVESLPALNEPSFSTENSLVYNHFNRAYTFRYPDNLELTITPVESSDLLVSQAFSIESIGAHLSIGFSNLLAEHPQQEQIEDEMWASALNQLIENEFSKYQIHRVYVSESEPPSYFWEYAVENQDGDGMTYNLFRVEQKRGIALFLVVWLPRENWNSYKNDIYAIVSSFEWDPNKIVELIENKPEN